MNKNTVIVYKMAWAKCALMAFVGAATAWTTTMSGVEWSTLGGSSRIGVVLGCLVSAVTVIIAFLDRSISRIEGEQEKIPGTPENVAVRASETAFLKKLA